MKKVKIIYRIALLTFCTYLLLVCYNIKVQVHELQFTMVSLNSRLDTLEANYDSLASRINELLNN